MAIRARTKRRSKKTTVHVVKAGDTLSEIAEKYSVKTDDLRRWNKLKGDTIRQGQKLTIRGGSASSKSKKSKETISYQVKSGDTLGGISEKYGVTVPQLMSWNGLKNHVIRPGQSLRVVVR